jgi:hypothetical protein
VVANSVFLPSCALEDCLVSRRFWLLVPSGSRLIDVTKTLGARYQFRANYDSLFRHLKALFKRLKPKFKALA